jgi:phosphomannomutase
MEELRARVERWIADDPDPEARAELRDLLARGADEELRERFAHGLAFGTAGLRGRLGAGPSRMNVATVRRASAGLARHLLDAVPGAAEAGIVVGHDARHGSARFAEEAAAVFSGAGLRTRRLPPLAPTPLLAFAVRHLGCAAGVMVTASHNPAQDNGYKVYLSDGAQISPPADERIAAAIDATGPLAGVPHGDGGERLGEEVAEAYLEAILAELPATDARDLRIVYTPLHGVGAGLCLEALARAGFPAPHVVAAQAAPDPDFPTAPRPNPEEAGVLDLALAAAAREDADVVLANDPDADRLAAAIPDGDGWRRLHGDETGALLADFLLERAPRPERALLVTTVASSTLLGRMAAASGARYVETLTGFKWIMRALAGAPEHRLLLGYEEALGYAVSDVVRDKDGISAALVLAQLAALQKRAGRTLADRLDDIAARFGRHATEPVTLELAGPDGTAQRERIMSALRADPPATLLGHPVTAVEDLRNGLGALPPSDVLILRAEGARVVVRPSGTEPKLKAYLEVVVQGADKATAAAALARLRAEVGRIMTA